MALMSSFRRNQMQASAASAQQLRGHYDEAEYRRQMDATKGNADEQ